MAGGKISSASATLIFRSRRSHNMSYSCRKYTKSALYRERVVVTGLGNNTYSDIVITRYPRW